MRLAEATGLPRRFASRNDGNIAEGCVVFAQLKKEWAEARGTVLRREYEDGLIQLAKMPEDLNKEVYICMAGSLEALSISLANINKIEPAVKLRLAKEARKQAKQFYKEINLNTLAGTYNLTKAHAAYLVSAYLESSTLPGYEAKFIYDSITHKLQSEIS